MSNNPEYVRRVERPRNFAQPQMNAALIESGQLIRARKARRRFDVDGGSLAVAVLDTGINASHVDFAGRLLAQRNFTADNNGNQSNANDGHSHGTNVTGIVAARRGLHQGIAPGAGIVSLKVLDNNGNGSFEHIRRGLEWVLEERERHDISVVCMSLSDPGNYQSDAVFEGGPLEGMLRDLRQARVAVCIAAGNGFHLHESRPGMAYPAILRHSVSVGAVFDADIGPVDYGGGLVAHTTDADRITPFSQRLHEDVNVDCRTDLFAPGSLLRSAGIGGPRAESVQQGTSQATPVAAGVVMLMQQFYRRATGALPEVENLVTWMRRGSVSIFDGDDEHDTVEPTGRTYRRVDAVGALEAVARQLDVQEYLANDAVAA